MNPSPNPPSSGFIHLSNQDILPNPTILLRRSKRYRTGNGQKIAQVVDEALDIARPLIEPKAVWAVKPVDGEARSILPPLPEAVYEKITLHFGVVCTIGGQVETCSQKYFREKRFALGYWIDQIGTFSISLLAQQMANKLCREFGAVRWAPGDNVDDQSFASQQELFDWVPADKIGVSLTSQKIMRPVKSLSFNLFAGPDLHGVECLVACSHCVWNGACDRQ